jgi:LysM repeat protein
LIRFPRTESEQRPIRCASPRAVAIPRAAHRLDERGRGGVRNERFESGEVLLAPRLRLPPRAESESLARMSRTTVAAIGALLFSPLATFADEAQTLQEIRELKQLMEQQMKRIDELTVEVGRLHQAVEAHKASIAPGPAPKREVGGIPPFAGYTDVLKPAPAKAEAPKAERAKPEPVTVPAEAKPEASGGVKHIVEKGETLTAIAKRYNVALPDLLKANKTVNDRKLQIGQSLSIPITQPSEPAKAPETPASENKENP